MINLLELSTDLPIINIRNCKFYMSNHDDASKFGMGGFDESDIDRGKIKQVKLVTRKHSSSTDDKDFGLVILLYEQDTDDNGLAMYHTTDSRIIIIDLNKFRSYINSISGTFTESQYRLNRYYKIALNLIERNKIFRVNGYIERSFRPIFVGHSTSDAYDFVEDGSHSIYSHRLNIHY